MLFETPEHIAMVDDVESLRVSGVAKPLDDRRRLRVDDDMDLAEPRREAEDRADASRFRGIVEARRSANAPAVLRQRASTLSNEPVPGRAASICRSSG
jgi:hypothetical protein